MSKIFQILNQLPKIFSKYLQIVITYIGVTFVYFIGIFIGSIFAFFFKPKDTPQKWSNPDTTNPLEVMY